MKKFFSQFFYWLWQVILFPFRVLGWIFKILFDLAKHEKQIYDDSKKYGYSRQFVRAFKVEQKRHEGTGNFYDGYTIEDHYRDTNQKDRR